MRACARAARARFSSDSAFAAQEPQTKAAAARAEAAKTYADQALVQRAPVLECAAEEPGNAVTRRQCGREVRATGALLAAAWSEMAAASVEYRDARAAAARHKAAEAVAADIRAARRRIALVRKVRFLRFFLFTLIVV